QRAFLVSHFTLSARHLCPPPLHGHHGEVEKRLLVQMREEGITLRDAAQAGMLVVTMTHKMLFEESAIFGADQHEMYHIARVLVASHTFHQDWPYRDQVKAALIDCYSFQQ